MILSCMEEKTMGLFSKKKKDADHDSESILKVSVSNSGKEYTFNVEGRLDTNTSPKLEEKINEVADDAEKMIFDLGKLEYISSAGLRVLLGAAQIMEDKGGMDVINVTESVREVFDLTGFNRVFNIK